LTTKYGFNFVRDLRADENDGHARIVLASENGLRVLSSSKYTVTDGTFNLIKGGYVLTTLMGYHENIGIPVAYLIAEGKDTDSYTFFFQVKKQ
jgi:hypothetical protein